MSSNLAPPLVIGIAGGSGSGKSTFVQRLAAGPLGAHLAILHHDAYYRDSGQMPRTEAGEPNWDHPDALENDLFVAHLADLIAGRPIDCPVYDFTTHRRTTQTRRLLPNRILLVEGILVLAIPAIRHLLDLKLYVETPADLRILRRTLRDLTERGRSPDSIATQYCSSVRPMHELIVEPSKIHADLLIPWIQDNPGALEVVSSHIAARLQ